MVTSLWVSLPSHFRLGVVRNPLDDGVGRYHWSAPHTALRDEASQRSSPARPARDPHLAHHARPVRLHRDLADAELETDLLVQQPQHHERHDLALAWRKRCMAFAQGTYLGLMNEHGAAAVDGLADGGKQLGFVERLGQEVQRALLH